MERSKGRQELGCCLAVLCVVCGIDLSSLVGCHVPPFYRPRGSRDYKWEKEEKNQRVEKVLRRSQVFLSPCACLANMADRVRDGVFADPHRAVPWLYPTSGYVPSYTGGRCGVPGSRAVTLWGVAGEVTICLSL